MPKIIFRGKTYYSVYEMPPNVRRAYEKEQKNMGADQEKPETVIDSLSTTPEPRVGMRGLMWGILAALVLAGIAYVLSRFIP
ncbi:MAG TPA: hypothetical protein VFG81_13255 [Anaerolineales bacterium]|jgi:hypothetical protein|nr:hypothetical protein [Anaerolineales bacterium]